MKKLFFAFLVVFIISCDKDENPVSDLSELLEFTVEASSEFTPVKTFIDPENEQVQVFSNNDFTASDFPLTLSPVLSVSPGASVVPASGSAVTFSNEEDFVKYTISSGDGLSTKDYYFTIRDKQIPNSNFENWFTETGMNGQPFPQPGKYGESTVWATTNMGTSIYSIYGTSALQDGGNTRIKIETVTTVALPLVAGALYIGKFDLDSAIEDPTNPVAAAKLGVPFIGRPSAVQFKYSFQSGAQLVQAVLKDPGNLFGGFDVFELEGKDKFGIEAVLEKRVGDNKTVIAQSNFESDQDITNLSTLKLPLQYLSNEDPTHFYISFSPSLDGGDFKGAVGSTLIIDDLEIIYE